MLIKTKIGIAALILAAFVLGGFALNAYKISAAEDNRNDYGFGFRRGGFGMLGKMNGENMPEMTEEMKAKMEEWKNMSEEERKAKMPPAHFGFMGPRGMNLDEINREVANLDNGIQITITSDNLDIVQNLHDWAEKMSIFSE